MSLPHIIPQHVIWDLIRELSQPQEKFSWHLSKGSVLWKDSFKVFILVIIWGPGTQDNCKESTKE